MPAREAELHEVWSSSKVTFIHTAAVQLVIILLCPLLCNLLLLFANCWVTIYFTTHCSYTNVTPAARMIYLCLTRGEGCFCVGGVWGEVDRSQKTLNAEFRSRSRTVGWFHSLFFFLVFIYLFFLAAVRKSHSYSKSALLAETLSHSGVRLSPPVVSFFL